MNVHVRTKKRRARLLEIERELELLKKKKRALERSRDVEAAEAPFREVEAAEPAGLSKPPAVPVSPSAPGIPLAGRDREGADGSIPGESGEERERFASYFMSGNLGRSGTQLRKERRAQRNKAILMAVLAAFLLIVVARFLVK